MATYKPLYPDVVARDRTNAKKMDAEAAAAGIHWKGGKAYRTVNSRLGPVDVRAASYDKHYDAIYGGGSGSGGSGGSGSGGGSLRDQLLTQYQQAFEQAKAANEERYNEARGLIGNLGTQQRQDINQAYGMQSSQGMQDLISRGLGSSTVVPTMKMGIERERQSATNRLEDMLNRQTIDLLQSRNDVYPDMQMMLGLMQNYGQAQNVPNMGYRGPDMGAMMKMFQGMMPQQGQYGQQSGGGQQQMPYQPPQMPGPPTGTTYPLNNPFTPDPTGTGTVLRQPDLPPQMPNNPFPTDPTGTGTVLKPGDPSNFDWFKLPGMGR